MGNTTPAASHDPAPARLLGALFREARTIYRDVVARFDDAYGQRGSQRGRVPVLPAWWAWMTWGPGMSQG
jgi:hypothetical protein